MRCNIATAFCVCALPLIATLSACSNLPPDQREKLQQALAVACNVDGTVVPLAQPVVATSGRTGATITNIDSLLVHPAVVAACQQIGGKPAGVTPVTPPATIQPVPAVPNGG